MFVPADMLQPVALQRSAATAGVRPGGCDLRVPYTGRLTPQAQASITSSLRRLMIEMRYGTRLKGISVTSDGDALTVTAVASNFAIKKWLDSGEFVAAVESAVRQAR